MAENKDVLSLDSIFFSSQTTSGSRQQEQLSYNKVVVENNQGSSGNNKLAAKGPIIEPLWLENCFDSRQQSRTMVDCFSLESSYIPTMCYVYACLLGLFNSIEQREHTFKNWSWSYEFKFRSKENAYECI